MTQTSKKGKHHRNCQENYLATKVNATEIGKKDKNNDKTKELSYIKFYIYK